MKVGMFLDMYKPHISGVTVHVDLTKAAMESAGHEVYVFTFGNREYPDDEPRILRSLGIPWGDTGYNFGFGFSADARRAVVDLDVAHVHHPFMSGRFALHECKRRGIPVVSTNHTRFDLYSDEYASFIPRSVRLAYIRGYLRRYYSRVDLVIAPSSGLARVLAEWGITANVRVLSNGVDLRPFASTTALDRAVLGLTSEDVVLAYLGRLGPEKNLELLVDAFQSAQREVPALALLLIGDGPMRRDVVLRASQRGLEGRILCTGHVPHDGVPALLLACDAFATASVSEVHPLTVLEAMGAGLPVLAIRSPGISDTVEDDVTGLLVAENPAELSSAMVRIATDEALRSRLGRRARSEASLYDVQNTSAALVRLYEELTARNGRASR